MFVPCGNAVTSSYADVSVKDSESSWLEKKKQNGLVSGKIPFLDEERLKLLS